MVVHGCFSQVALMSMRPLLVCLVLAQHNMILSNCPNAAIILNYLLCFWKFNYWKFNHQFKQLQCLDREYHDIPLAEEQNAPSTRMPRQDLRFNSWTCQECRCNTSFRKDALREIYDCFNLANVPTQQGHHDGFIRVFTGHSNYLFHPEELFLFLMMKNK